MEPVQFLDGLSGYFRASTGGSADKPIRLAVIDPAYDPFVSPYPSGIPLPKVTFEGETTLSGKTYPVAAGYIPMAGARVWMVPIGNTYLITGSATHYTAQGFYSEPDLGSYGVEFGGGSYFDSDSGLFLLTDADIQGDLSVSGIGAQLARQASGDGPSAISTTSTWYQHSALYLDLSVGKWLLEAVCAYSGDGGDISTRWDFTGTWAGGKFCAGLSPFALATTGTAAETNTRESSTFRHGYHAFATAISYATESTANYAGLRESGIVTVTVAGRWQIGYTQRVSSTDPTIMRGPSYMTGLRIG